MTGIQTNFTAADMLGGKKTGKSTAPVVKKPAFFAPPAVEVAPEPVVKQDEISEDEE
jgi:hypothetical protein